MTIDVIIEKYFDHVVAYRSTNSTQIFGNLNTEHSSSITKVINKLMKKFETVEPISLKDTNKIIIS